MADSENSVIEINFDTGKIEDGLNDPTAAGEKKLRGN